MSDYFHASVTLSTIFLVPNLAVVICMAFRRRLLKSNSNKLILSLLLAHTVSNIFGFARNFLPGNLYIYWTSPTGVFIAYLCLGLLSVDRLVAVQNPYRYESIPQWFIWAGICSSWLLPLCYYVAMVILISGISEKKAEKETRLISSAILVVFTLASTLLLAGSNFIMYRIAKRQIRKIASSTPQPSALKSSDESKTEKKRAASQNREIKAAFICIGLSATMILLWLPMNIYRVLVLAGTVLPVLRDVGILLGIINSFADPVLYMVLSHDLRKEIVSFYMRRRRVSRSDAMKSSEYPSTVIPVEEKEEVH